MSAVSLAPAFESIIAKITAEVGYAPSKYQIGVFSFIATGTGNGLVQAVAGSGKTVTLELSLNFIPDYLKVAMVAFNSHIAEELQTRLGVGKKGTGIGKNGRNNKNVLASTIHSIGCRALWKNNRPQVVENKTLDICLGLWNGGKKIENKEERSRFRAIAFVAKRLVSLFKNFGYGIVRELPTLDDAKALVNQFDIVLPEGDEAHAYEMSLKAFTVSNKKINVIDFDDMLYLPLLLRLPLPKHDYVFVDESQDLNPIQIAFVGLLLKPQGGRIVFVGDRFQAIYAFRGADADAMDTIAGIYSTTELPLSICWRCPKSHVALAKEIVEQIEAAPNAPEGIIRTINDDDFLNDVKAGDYVLCRTNAPLIGYCLGLIAKGIKATVKGRDIGENLKTLCRNIVKADFGGTVRDQIGRHQDREVAKLDEDRDSAKIESIIDKHDSLVALSGAAQSFDEIVDRIDGIFSDKKAAGVTFSSVHRAKGLEAPRIFILCPELMPHPMAKKAAAIGQEYNLMYVARTRAKFGKDGDGELIFVDKHAPSIKTKAA